MESLPALINSEGCPLKTDRKIRLLWDDDKESWFVGTDIANILGYKDEWKSIDRYVDKEDKCELETPRFVRSSKLEKKMNGFISQPHLNML